MHVMVLTVHFLLRSSYATDLASALHLQRTPGVTGGHGKPFSIHKNQAVWLKKNKTKFALLGLVIYVTLHSNLTCWSRLHSELYRGFSKISNDDNGQLCYMRYTLNMAAQWEKCHFCTAEADSSAGSRL